MTDTPNQYDDAPALQSLSLGKKTSYDNSFDAKLLQPVPRSLNRDGLQLNDDLPFYGDDLWTGFELSWLNTKGKPVVAMANFTVPFDSENLVESKSFKLYLNSLNQQRFDSPQAVEKQLSHDLSHCAQGSVTVELILANQFTSQSITTPQGICIDELDIAVDDYQFNADYLLGSVNTNETAVNQRLYSNLLKSNCLITNQPDWGSVEIHYHGPAINQEALLLYLISFRQHNEFHEQCAERIFTDLLQYCHCTKLSVNARYTRRGGLDINPFRTNFEPTPKNIRQARQ